LWVCGVLPPTYNSKIGGMHMDKQIVKINDKDLFIKEFKGQRVITFKDIDTLHERPEGTARKRFNDNKKHFIKDTDYFKISASEIRTYKIMTISNKAHENITLITESGYLMLVKSLTDDLAWKVQRELVNNYFRVKEVKQLSAKEELKLHYEVLEEHEEEIKTLKQDVADIKENTPLYNIECKELQGLVRKIGVKTLGGHGTPAYKDNSLRGKVYSDIQRQLKREFGVRRYEAIKRCQLDKAKDIVEGYGVPTILKDEITLKNSQLHM